MRGLVPWGALALLPPRGGALLPPGAQGEIATSVPWASEGYVRDECLVPHAGRTSGGGGRTSGGGGPLVRTGDAGRWSHEEAASTKERTVVLMQRLRPPIEVHRLLSGSPHPSSDGDGGALPAAKQLRLLVQPFEVEEALLRVNPAATAAAALQGPRGQLFCAVASPLAPMALSSTAGWPVQPDAMRHVRQLPTSPAGKVLLSEIMKYFG